MIKFVWLGLVCCGVVNGLVFKYVSSQEKYIFLMILAMVCFVLITVHRLSTDKFCSEDADYDEYHFPIFRYSALAFIVLALIALVAGFEAVSLGLILPGIAFIFVCFQESKYT